MNVTLPSNLLMLRILIDEWGFATILCLMSLSAGFMVTARTGFLPITLVPIVVSAGGTLANGLYFILATTALNGDYGKNAPNVVRGHLAASFLADISWLIQEAGLPFYSYLIVLQLLQGPIRLVFITVFWTLIAMIATGRLSISAYRIRIILHGLQDSEYQGIISTLHVTMFCLIALLEVICSLSLIIKLQKSCSTSLGLGLQNRSSNLFRHMMRSTTVRLVILSSVGITRAITYSFSMQSQDQISKESWIDFCAYIFECTYPFFMYIDLLTTRLVNSLYRKGQTPVRKTNFPRRGRISMLV